VINDLHSQLSLKLSTYTPYQNLTSSPISPSPQNLLNSHKTNWLSTLDSQIRHLNTSLKSLSALHSSSSQPFYDEAELPEEMLRAPLKQMENVVEGAHELMKEVIERLTDTVGEIDGLQKEKSNRERKKHKNIEVETVEIEQMVISTVEAKEALEKDFDKIEW
jgi:seryl-tRNA synthetase